MHGSPKAVGAVDALAVVYHEAYGVVPHEAVDVVRQSVGAVFTHCQRLVQRQERPVAVDAVVDHAFGDEVLALHFRKRIGAGYFGFEHERAFAVAPGPFESCQGHHLRVCPEVPAVDSAARLLFERHYAAESAVVAEDRSVGRYDGKGAVREIVVRIDREEELAACQRQGGVVGPVLAAVCLSEIADGEGRVCGERCDHRLGAVGGTVVDYEPFEIGEGLTAEASECPFQRIRPVIRRCKYRQQHILGVVDGEGLAGGFYRVVVVGEFEDVECLVFALLFDIDNGG